MKNGDRWHYLINQFDNSTNYKSMCVLATDHLTRLRSQRGNSYFDNMIVYYTPFLDNYTYLYTCWISVKGLYKGRTSHFNKVLSELIEEKLPYWQVKILNIYNRKTPQYKALFFRGIKVFSKSTYENRISALRVLGISLKEYPELADVREDVEAFIEVLVSARFDQQNHEGELVKLGAELNKARRELASALYHNLGMLMAYYNQNPEMVEDFFEIRHLKRKRNKKSMTEEEEGVIPLHEVDATHE